MMNLANMTPKSITASRSTRIVTIIWNDGHQSEYPFGLVRAACPCASCRGGHENMRSEPDPLVFSSVLPEGPQAQLKNIRPVGTYAVSFLWEDGHDLGIYTWAFLRALCPCQACRKEANE